ncbi:MAG: beta-ketoacyl-ACP synthase [Gammaproteobacteria bacterium]
MAGAWISAYTVSCAAGVGLHAVRRSVANRATGLRHRAWPGSDIDTWLGQVPAALSDDWPDALAPWDSRNNRLAWLGLHQDGFREQADAMIEAVGPARVGLLVGTSTSSIGRTEEAYAGLTPDGHFGARFIQPTVHNPHSTGAFLAHVIGIRGPVMTISTACSSSAKVLASADRWLRCGVVDAVVVAGVDSLCRSTIYGFESLQLVSRNLCRPFDARRDGLNIGEAAALALLVREPSGIPRARLLGYGESCDAFHMSSPHPEGLGARRALHQALARAGITPAEVGYVNLHGTGTRANDSVESLVLAAVLPPGIPASSTKGWTGHTLGAAGLVEAVFAMEAINTGLLPGNLNLDATGDDIAYPVLRENVSARVDVVASNSFGFGGNNCVVILGRAT